MLATSSSQTTSEGTTCEDITKHAILTKLQEISDNLKLAMEASISKIADEVKRNVTNGIIVRAVREIAKK